MINLLKEMAKVQSRRDHFLAKLPGIMSTHDSVLQAWDRAILDMQSLDSVYPSPTTEQRLSIVRSLVECINQLHHIVPDTIQWRDTFIETYFGEMSTDTVAWINSLKLLRNVMDSLPNYDVGLNTAVNINSTTGSVSVKVNDEIDTTFEWTPFTLISATVPFNPSQRRFLTAGPNLARGIQLFAREVESYDVTDLDSGLLVRAIKPVRCYHDVYADVKPENIRYKRIAQYGKIAVNEFAEWRVAGSLPAANASNSMLIGTTDTIVHGIQKINYLLMAILDDIISGTIDPSLISYGQVVSNPALVKTPVDYILRDWYHITNFMRETVNTYADIDFLYVTDQEFTYMGDIIDDLA